jgi:hypothetical protein
MAVYNADRSQTVLKPYPSFRICRNGSITARYAVCWPDTLISASISGMSVGDEFLRLTGIKGIAGKDRAIV